MKKTKQQAKIYTCAICGNLMTSPNRIELDGKEYHLCSYCFGNYVLAQVKLSTEQYYETINRLQQNFLNKLKNIRLKPEANILPEHREEADKALDQMLAGLDGIDVTKAIVDSIRKEEKGGN